MNEHGQKEDILRIIKEIEQDPKATQRVLSDRLGMSLGKTNYILKELIKRGLIRVGHFTINPGKLRKINYILTKAGLENKVSLVKHFLKIKKTEYDVLKKEWDELRGK